MKKKIIQPIFIPSWVPRRGCSIFFCSNTLPSFATEKAFRGNSAAISCLLSLKGCYASHEIMLCSRVAFVLRNNVHDQNQIYGDLFQCREVVCMSMTVYTGISTQMPVRVFQKTLFQKKISAAQYVPLQGIYKPDPKAFFSNSTLKGQTGGTT